MKSFIKKFFDKSLLLFLIIGACNTVLSLAEIYQTACVFPVFKDMHYGISRPLALIAGVVAAGAARPAVFQRPRRGGFAAL